VNAFPQNGLPGIIMILNYLRAFMVKEWFRANGGLTIKPFRAERFGRINALRQGVLQTP
jgi:hypothetical protein